MSARNRRWLIGNCVMLVAIFLAIIALGALGAVYLFGNRQVGNGNRTVNCATLEHVAPDVHLPECAPIK